MRVHGTSRTTTEPSAQRDLRVRGGRAWLPQARFVATVGFYNDGRPGEIFIHPSKTGSDRDISVQESAIAVSFAFQFGVGIGDIRSAMPRTSDGRPEGPVGTLLDLLAQSLKAEAAE